MALRKLQSAICGRVKEMRMVHNNGERNKTKPCSCLAGRRITACSSGRLRGGLYPLARRGVVQEFPATIANGEAPRKHQQMSLETFTDPSLMYLVRVADSVKDGKDGEKADALRYSRVTDILKIGPR